MKFLKPAMSYLLGPIHRSCSLSLITSPKNPYPIKETECFKKASSCQTEQTSTASWSPRQRTWTTWHNCRHMHNFSRSTRCSNYLASIHPGRCFARATQVETHSRLKLIKLSKISLITNYDMKGWGDWIIYSCCAENHRICGSWNRSAIVLGYSN